MSAPLGRHGPARPPVPVVARPARPAPVVQQVQRETRRGPLVIPKRQVYAVCVLLLVVAALSGNWGACVPVLVVLVGVYRGIA